MPRFTDKRVELLLNALRKGEPRMFAVKQAGISYMTFRRAMRAKVNFVNEVKEAEIAGLAEIEASARSKIRASEAWQAQAWLLERMMADKYKLKTETHNTQPINIIVDKDDAKL